MPSLIPSNIPSKIPTNNPTNIPSVIPTYSQTYTPTANTLNPTINPTLISDSPTQALNNNANKTLSVFGLNTPKSTLLLCGIIVIIFGLLTVIISVFVKLQKKRKLTQNSTNNSEIEYVYIYHKIDLHIYILIWIRDLYNCTIQL